MKGVSNVKDKTRIVQEIIDSNRSIPDAEQLLEDIAYALEQSAIVAMTNNRGTILYVNDLFVEISKYEREELIGQDHRLLNSGSHPKEYFKNMWRTIGSGQVWEGQFKNRAKDGSYYWVDTVIVPFLNDKGKPYQYIAIRWDITEKKAMEEEVRKSNELYRLITENSSDFIAVLDPDGLFQYVSPSFGIILNYSEEELMSSPFYHLLDDEEIKRVASCLRPDVTNELVEFKLLTKDGDTRHMAATINAIRDAGEYRGNYVIVMRDVTSEKESEERILDLAYNDQLTSLLNRTAFRRQLVEKLEHAQREETKLALVYLNIDRFRYFNDALGHAGGDTLLEVFADRLKTALGSENLIGRISGDEFAFTLVDVMDEEDALKRVEAVRQLLQEPILFLKDEHDLTVSCGVSLYPQHTDKAGHLVTRAEKALHTAKVRGGNRVEMYESGTVNETIERVLLENELRKSVEAEHFTLEYQPKVDLSDESYVGFEALVRWEHPDLGRIAPDKFIPLAEETKVIVPLGTWILEQSCRQMREWIDRGYPPLRMAVNFSVVQLEEDNIVQLISDMLSKYELEPEQLEVELTESTFADQGMIFKKVSEIRALGVSVAIDDFGTGYSTFSYIKDLPVDTVKIDRAFISDIDENADSNAIVRAIVTLARTANLRIVAEGVETKEQGVLLHELGCHIGQGYYYSRPVPPKECEQLMDEQLAKKG